MSWSRLEHNNILINQLDARLQSRLADELGKEYFDSISAQPLNTLNEEDRQSVKDLLGWFDLNEAMRQLLLGVISELWVDYLTRVEALRVSIGLEAYAQRDPLVQYKGRASEMFQQLLADIRIGVISRLFSFRPRPQAPNLAEARADGAASESTPVGDSGVPDKAPSQAPAIAAAPVPSGGVPGGSGKKKRRRH